MHDRNRLKLTGKLMSRFEFADRTERGSAGFFFDADAAGGFMDSALPRSVLCLTKEGRGGHGVPPLQVNFFTKL